MKDVCFKNKINSHLTTNRVAHFFPFCVSQELAVVQKPGNTSRVFVNWTLFFQLGGHSADLTV